MTLTATVLTLVGTEDVNVTALPGSVVLLIQVFTTTNMLTSMVALLETTLGNTSAASAALGVDVLSVEPLLYSQGCARDGSDDVCDEFATADWSSFAAEYCALLPPLPPHSRLRLTLRFVCDFSDFYFYDQTPDEHDLRYWEWPRKSPTSTALAGNGFCEDGLESTTGLPNGEYFVLFAGPSCATSAVNFSQTGVYGGCGRQIYTPCVEGKDCADCGRSATASSSTSRRRRADALPSPRNVQDTIRFLRAVKLGLKNGTITDFRLPAPHTHLLERL